MDNIFDYVREMEDYELRDLILNVFNFGRLSILEEMREKNNIGLEEEFNVEAFLSNYSSMCYYN